MLVNDKEVLARLNSPSNLISQIRSGFNSSKSESRKNAMSLFTGNGNSSKIPVTSIDGGRDLQVPLEIKYTNPLKKNKVEQPQATTSETSAISSPVEIISKELIEKTEEAALLPAVSPLDVMLSESEAEIKLALAHNSALNLVEKTITTMHAKIDNMKTSDLPRVLTAASQVVSSIRKERLELQRSDKDREVHFHFYTPQQKQLSDYEVIDVESAPANG